ncbi:ExeM/NucH family extracellular endonuclease [uncultured Roseobacter sp.]|uniref:ExeM/NucH family extracellular endonuclease n=1 Tax=uncultured Roseobacter sp. TaxID=114847 RepID=UPI002623FE39|nr:ExeM/NucH family extracellular endonuclease [uncultured Roseobacter sp.]
MLAAGDIALIGLTSDNPDDFAFVLLSPVAVGTEILFTDNGVQADGSFRSNEGVLRWTAPADLAAGTVVSLLGNAEAFTAVSGSFALSASGDQITAYQTDGTGAATFLYSLQGNSTVFEADATSSNTTALAPGLTEGTTAVAIGASATQEFDNIRYQGPTGGTRAELLAAIGDPANWAGADVTADLPAPVSAFTVTPADASPTLQVTEIWPGQSGTDVTEDWFEITNTGTTTWTRADNGPLFYDDASADAAVADEIQGLTSLAPGQSAIVVVGVAADAAEFTEVWQQAIDLSGVEVGYVDGAGLGGDGDAVTLWLGDPDLGGALLDSEAYPDTAGNDAASYDVDAGAFSQPGSGGAVTTLAEGGSAGDTPAVGSPGNGAAITPPPTSDFTLELFHFADQEAGIPALEDTPNFSAVLAALKAQDLGDDGIEDNTLVLSSGDAIIPGVFFDASDPVFGGAGRGDILIQNELGVQAIALGNHEFDRGTAALADLIAADGDYAGALFPYLSANLDVSTDADLAPLEVAGGAAPLANSITSSVVIDTGPTAEKIGVIGATTPLLASISSPGGVTIAPGSFDGVPSEAQLDALAAEIQAEVDALLAATPGLDKVILLSHMQQISIETALIPRLSGVDIVVAGGSNTRLFDDTDTPRPGDSDQGQYPTFLQDADGNTTALVNTDGNYTYVGRLVVDFDADGHVIAQSYDAEVSGAYATDDAGVAALNAEGLIDPEIQAIVDDLRTEILATESNVFGVSDVFLNGTRGSVRTEETNLGNLTADANLAAAKAVDSTVLVSLKNGGGIRNDIGQTVVPTGGFEPVRLPNEEITDADGTVIKPQGGISQTDITNALSFNNGLTLVTVTRAELVALLEHGLAASSPDDGNTQGRFPQVSGVQFSFDLTLPPGARIVSAAITDAQGTDIDVLVREGALQGDGAAEIRMVTLGFLAGGGDGYPFPDLAEARVNTVSLVDDTAAPEDRTGVATFAADGSEQDALAEYLAANFATPETAFDAVDTDRDQDARLQNLAFREDTVIDASTGAPSEFTYTQSFEAEATGARYTDTGDPLVDHDLVNNPGESAVDSTASGIALNGTLAFDATYENTRDGTGLTDGDFVGVSSFTGTVGSYTDGTQGYQFNDTDGRMITTFEAVDSSAAGEVQVSLDLFIQSDGYEDDDTVEIRAVVEGGDDVVLFSASGDALEDVAGSWINLSGVVAADATSVQLVAAVDTNSGSESAYIDNIEITTDFIPTPVLPDAFGLELTALDTEHTGGAEIVAFDSGTDRAFVTSGDGITVLNAENPASLAIQILLTPVSNGAGDNAVTSVSVANGILAAAVPGADPLQPGQVFLYDTGTLDFLGAVTVGALPDMLTFDATGSYLLVANEGQSAGDENEPGALPNPAGSVSVIAVNTADPAASTVTTLGFDHPSLTAETLAAASVRINGQAPSVAADIEPEYITIDGTTAYIALQENNAVAVIEDITNPGGFTIDTVIGLGTKDHSASGNGLDASNRDDGINIDTYDIRGLYMPDGMASYTVAGRKYFVTANEGDGRDVDESRGADLVDGDLTNGEVDANISAELRAQLADDAQLGRLKFSNVDGDTDGDGDIDVLHSFGARSFTIFDDAGNVVFDSGDDFAQIIAREAPEVFNSNGTADSFDSRSDDKGAEPESVVIGEIGGRSFAFVGLERAGGVMVYDISDPSDVDFITYVRTEGDIGPEGLAFISAADSPTGGPLLAVTSEVSGTLTFYDVSVAEDITLISEVQGDGAASALVGETVTIQAIVTADFQSNGFSTGDLGGFFVQEEMIDYDASSLTSEGIFIADGATPLLNVAVGDLVTITGTVAEDGGRTQINADTVTIEASGQTLPDATVVDFGPDMSPNLEAVEGMIAVIEEMIVTELFDLDRFGTLTVADERFAQFTQNNAPDAEAFAAYVAEVEARSITIDDGRLSQNDFDIRIPDGDDGLLTSADNFRMGDTLSNITGVVDFDFGEYRLQAPDAEYTPTNPRPETPEDTGGNFKVASLNVLNYFTTLNDGATTTSIGAGPRGANTQAELDRQTEKLVETITAMDADVVGLIEIENHVSSAPLASLVAAVNAALGSEVYGFINTGQVGTDAITNAVIYKLETAKPVGTLDILDDDSFVDPLNSPRDGLNRPAVTQSFEHIDSGEVLTVSVNHLKSKGSLSGLAVDEDQGDGQGNNNATREEAAKVLAAHLETDPTGVGDGDVLIIGDMNAYAQEDPITALEDVGYTDIAYDALGEDAYSYVFDGQTGTLDYILGKGGILEDVTGVTEWHINADEADAVDYQLEIRNNAGTVTFGTRDPAIFDGDTAARNSDHDPVIVSFQFDAPVNLVEGTTGSDRLIGTDGDDRIESGAGRYDRADGGAGADTFVFGAETQNGAREQDFITGFDATEDSLTLTDGTEIASIRELSFGLRIIFEGDNDSLILQGSGLTADSLTILVEDSPLA